MESSNLEKVKSEISSECPELAIIWESKQTIDIGLDGIAFDTEKIQDAQAKMSSIENTGILIIRHRGGCSSRNNTACNVV